MPDTSAGSVAAAVAVAAAAAGGSSLPSSAAPLPSGAPDTRRASTGDKGIPYYEKIRKDLREMLQRKKLLDRSVAALEDQIAKSEASYLEDTHNGNIIRGFDNYIKGTAARRRNAIGDADRVFSMSSATSVKAAQQEAEAASQSQSASASVSTPSANQIDQKPSLLKKKTIKRRKGEDGSESPSDVDTPGPKRVRISFSRQPT